MCLLFFWYYCLKVYKVILFEARVDKVSKC
jgi:hypothetical protein